jgi:NAD(P)H-nitrite reductase large subunit
MAGKAAEGVGYLRTLRRRRVPVRLGYRITAARPGPGGEVAQVDVAGTRPGAGTETVAVDAVAVGYGFTAALDLPIAIGCELARDPADGAEVVRVDEAGRTSAPGVFAAGEITGVGGADLAAVEGTLAGLAAAGRRLPYRLQFRQRMLSRFARALRRAHALDPGLVARVSDDTVVCRCEEVTAGQIRNAVRDLGADDARSVKLLSRAGMGLCQGRMCAQNAEAIVAEALGGDLPDPGGLAARPLAAAVELGDLAAFERRSEL